MGKLSSWEVIRLGFLQDTFLWELELNTHDLDQWIFMSYIDPVCQIWVWGVLQENLAKMSQKMMLPKHFML